MPWPTRRHFAHTAGLAAFGLSMPAPAPRQAAPADVAVGGDWLPCQDPVTVKEMVTVSHSNLTRVRELVEQHPTLVNAAVDWGFGDWEDALGAASHVGRREIAEYLLAHGARHSIFAATMLGQLDVVRACVTARPGIQRTLGPHGITLLAHAKAGGRDAVPVLTYLEALGDADTRSATVPLAAADRAALVGRYVFGPGSRDFFDVDVNADALGIIRPGGTRRGLNHLGALVFFPVGVPSLRIAFGQVEGKVTRLTLAEPDVYLVATRR